MIRGADSRKRRLLKRGLALVALVECAALVVIVATRAVNAGNSSAHLAVAAVHHHPTRRRRHRRARASGYPTIPSMIRASAFLETRSGQTAFAVVDTRGHEYGLNMHDHFVSASTVKSMLLVAYLRDLAAQHGTIGASSQALLYPMIHVSDNRAAEAVWHLVGNAGLEHVAHDADMTDFVFGADWANESISAADMARFFYRMDSLIPHQFRGYARQLLSGIDETQSWGIPVAARPAWTVFFKGGWRLTGRGQLVSQIARLERPGHRVAIAVMTDGDPSMGYGIETIQGVAERLLGRV
jgi:hypothetical protein